MATPSNVLKINDHKKVVLSFYRSIGKIILICCILLFVSLMLPYYEGDYYDSRGSDYPFHKEMDYNGLWTMFNAFTSNVDFFLILMILGVFLLIFGSVFYFVSKRKLSHHKNQISVLRLPQKSLIIILISGLLIFIPITSRIIIGLPPSLDPNNPLDFNYIYDSDSIFLIYEQFAYGFFVTSLISLILIIISITEIYLGYRLTTHSETGRDE